MLLNDFSNFQPLSRDLATVDFVLCALGISWYQTTGEAQYRQITHDYVMACARVAAIANPSMHFCFVSGHGASATSSQAWARIKAETEHDLGAVFGSRPVLPLATSVRRSAGRPSRRRTLISR